MRFLMTSKTEQAADEALYVEMGKFIDELTRSGVLLAAGGMELEGTLIKSSGGELTVIDGPFTEAKEAAGGFALIEVRSREEALEISRRFFTIVGDGQSHMQQIFD